MVYQNISHKRRPVDVRGGSSSRASRAASSSSSWPRSIRPPTSTTSTCCASSRPAIDAVHARRPADREDRERLDRLDAVLRARPRRHAARLRVVPPALRRGHAQDAADASGSSIPGCTGAISGAATSARSAATAADGTSARSSPIAEGLDLLRAVEGAGGRYAGVPVAELHAAESGKVLAKFVVDAEGLIRNSPYRPPTIPTSRSVSRPGRVLCERFHTGTSPTWDRQRREVARAAACRFPSTVPTSSTPSAAPRSLADRAAFLRASCGRQMRLTSRPRSSPPRSRPKSASSREKDSAPEILRAMCVRCHAAAADPHLRRARFNAEAIDRSRRVTATFLAIRRSLSLPRAHPS